ncbi:MAG TPA: DNA repair protein RadC [Polyangiaceae bacterium]|nr:DNA repair protein RadC [Polyangiaceae bacterium]
MPDHRERALRVGVEVLSDQDLLAIVLGTGSTGEPVNLLAATLLDSEGGVTGLSRNTPHRLAGRRGIGPAKAVRLAAAFELGRRAQIHEFGPDPLTVRHFEQVVAWARPRLATLDHEEVWLLMLDAKNGLRSVRRISQGGSHACALTARDILRPALRDGASAIVLIHNHPSGDPTPSPEDVEMTKNVMAACDVVGLALFDHVVVARRGACSMFEAGTL